jgi:hypothetical protein
MRIAPILLSLALLPAALMAQAVQDAKPYGAHHKAAAAAQPDLPEGGQPRVFMDVQPSSSNRFSARGQSIELIIAKDFDRYCPAARETVNQQDADYTVVTDSPSNGFSRMQITISNRNGDVVGRVRIGGTFRGAVQKVCAQIMENWPIAQAQAAKALALQQQAEQREAQAEAEKARAARAAEELSAEPEMPAIPLPAHPAAAPAQPAVATPQVSAGVIVTSTPDGADIEIDGAFVGSTPTTVALTAGNHTVIVRKKGYQSWQRTLKITAGVVRLNAELEAAVQ